MGEISNTKSYFDDGTFCDTLRCTLLTPMAVLYHFSAVTLSTSKLPGRTAMARGGTSDGRN